MKRRPASFLASFTLVEMLTVIAIIAILAGLTLSAFSGVMKTAARSRAKAEIQAISTALESYNSDNGAYPPSVGFSSTNGYTGAVANQAGQYQTSSACLYTNLTGDSSATFGDGYPANLTAGTKIYMTFKSSQLGNDNASGGTIYIKDPFGNSYGYFTGGATTPYNGQNQFDLWSTGGDVSTPAVTNSWISNWGLGN